MTPSGRRSMTLNLSAQEMETLESFAKKKELSKTAVIRQALRLYVTVDVRLEDGEKLYFEDRDSQKAEVVVL